MLVRCLHCHEPIELPSDSDLRKVDCPSCGGSFNLVGDDTLSSSGKTTRRLGPFELIARVGGGAFGTVWQARDPRLDRTVAIKVPRQGQLNADEAEQFLREARHAAQLRHPNIVAVHEVGRDGDTVFIVSDFVQGATLDDWLTARKLSPREAAQLCVEIAEALHHAHEAGVIHRDLKPGNVMVDMQGHPYLMDFGLSRREVGEVTMTVDGQVMGTPAYMSPEQAGGRAHEADRRSDVYSLGVILFRLLTGELPFRGSAQMVIVQKQRDDAPSVRRLNSRISRDLDTICLKCLEREPRKRYATAQALADDLRRWLTGEPIHARAITRTARAWRWCERNPLVACLTVGIAAVLLTGVGVSSYFAVERSKEATSARIAEARAQEKAEDAEKARGDLERQSYALLMVAAFQAWETVSSERATQLLLEARARQGQSARPDLAWRFLWQRCQEGNPETLDVGGMSRCLTYSPDGKYLAAGLADGAVVLHELETKQNTFLELPKKASKTWGTLECLRFTPDQKYLVAGGALQDSSGFVCLWEISTRRPTLLPLKHIGRVCSVAVSSDGTLGASVSAAPVGHDATQAGCNYKVWTIPNGNEQRSWTTPYISNPQVAFSSQANGLLAGSGRGYLHFWRIDSGEETVSAESGVIGFAVSPEGHTLVTGGEEGVRLWELKSGVAQKRERLTWRRGDAVAFSPDGTLVAARDRDSGKVRVWFRESHQQKAQFVAGYEARKDLGSLILAFSADSNRITLGGDRVRTWDLRHWRSTSIDGLGTIYAVFPSAKNDSMVVAHQTYEMGKGTARIELSTRAKKGTYGAFLASSLDGARIATLGDDGLVRVWDVNTGKQLLALDDSWCPPVSLSADGRSGVANGKEARLRQFDVASGKSTDMGGYNGTLSIGFSYPAFPRVLALSPTGGQLVTAINVADRKVQVEIRDLQSGTRHPLGSCDSEFVGACFSPTGKYLVVTPAFPEWRGGMVRVWDLRGTEPLGLAESPGVDRLHRLRFAPNEEMFVMSGRAPGDLVLHDIVRKQTSHLAGSTGAWVGSLAFSSDGRTLVTASLGGQVRFLRIPTGEELGTLNLDEQVSLVELTQGDHTLITASIGGVVRLWPIAPAGGSP